jgi:ligand-binding sensor domain-containing protein
MIITKFRNPIFSLLLVSIFFTSCNGQTKSEKDETLVEKLSFTSKKTKLTKTQGTNEYQNVHCIIQDKNGNLWFGTTGEGVYRYDGKEFTQFTEKDGLSNNKVWSILEDTLGNIWFGTDDGVSLYNGKHITKVSFNTSTSSFLETAITQSNKNTVWSIFQDKKGIILFGTDNGIYCYNGKIFSYFLDNVAIVNKSNRTLKSVQCIFQDKNGKFWFGSGPMAFEGINVYDGKSLTNFKPQDEGWIRTITEDKNGTLLFATRHIGMITYDGENFTGFYQPQKIRKELINTVLVDSKGNIWYGSDYTNDRDITTGGLWQFDGKSFVEFTKKDGLGNTSIYSLTEDKAGNIWIGTRNCGLYRYDGQIFKTFSE